MKRYAIPNAEIYREELIKYRHALYLGEDPHIGDVCHAMMLAEDALEEFIAERKLMKSIIENMTVSNSVPHEMKINPSVTSFANRLLKEFKNKVLNILEIDNIDI